MEIIHSNHRKFGQSGFRIKNFKVLLPAFPRDKKRTSRASDVACIFKPANLSTRNKRHGEEDPRSSVALTCRKLADSICLTRERDSH